MRRSRRRGVILAAVSITCFTVALGASQTNHRHVKAGIADEFHEFPEANEARTVRSKVDVSVPGEVSTALAFVNGEYIPIRRPVRRVEVTYTNGDTTEDILEGAPLDPVPEQDPALRDVTPTEAQARAAAAALGEPFPG